MKQNTKYKSGIYILKFLILFFLALTLSNCQVEEEIDKKESSIQTVGINEAVSFLKQNSINSNSKTGKKTLTLPDLTAVTQEKINGSDQLLTVIPLSTNNKEEYSRILMSRISGVLRVVVFSMYSDKDNATEYFSGKIMIRNLNGDFVNGFRVENGIYVYQYQIQKTTKNITKREGGEETPFNGEKLNGLTIDNNYRRPNAATPWLYLYHDLDDSGGGFGNYSWDSGSGGGGGGEGTSSPETPIEEELPPSCESFNFVSNKGANWQEALIKNVGFKIVLLTPNGYRITQMINYPQAISFGMPINFNKGNGDVTSGVAATVSAKVLELSMGETIHRYGNKDVPELTVRIYFQERLQKNYADYTNGGRVNFNSASPINATNYKTNSLGTGDCS